MAIATMVTTFGLSPGARPAMIASAGLAYFTISFSGISSMSADAFLAEGIAQNAYDFEPGDAPPPSALPILLSSTLSILGEGDEAALLFAVAQCDGTHRLSTVGLIVGIHIARITRRRCRLLKALRQGFFLLCYFSCHVFFST